MAGKTFPCVVINPGMFLSSGMNAKELPVGSEVELTERQFNAFSGKVRIKEDQKFSTTEPIKEQAKNQAPKNQTPKAKAK